MKHETSAAFGTEVVLTVENGMQLRADGEDRDGTSYVRVCDPEGHEAVYWSEDEWRDDPGRRHGSDHRRAVRHREG